MDDQILSYLLVDLEAASQIFVIHPYKLKGRAVSSYPKNLES